MLLCAVAVAVAFALPSAAAGVPRTTPPGVSELDQYTETILGAGGEHTIKPPGDGGESVLSPSTEKELQQLGPAGRATARLANETAPGGTAPSDKARGGAGDGEGSGVDALIDATTGSGDGGLGIWLPLILAAVAALGVGYALLRRRAGHPG
jgi:hypothetical protein